MHDHISHFTNDFIYVAADNLFPFIYLLRLFFCYRLWRIKMIKRVRIRRCTCSNGSLHRITDMETDPVRRCLAVR